MEAFSISNMYLDDQNRKTIDINPLPKKHCSFDCVFCPFEQTQVKTDERHTFKETDAFISNLRKRLQNEPVDLVFINPYGEALSNQQLIDIVQLIKKHNAQVKLLSNGYIFSKVDYRNVLNLCDEVIGELAVTNEMNFKKLQRPLEGYTLASYIHNMAVFNQQYPGKFTLAITILKNYSDTAEAIQTFRRAIEQIKPHEVFLESPSKAPLRKVFGVTKEKLDFIGGQLGI